MCVCVYIGLIVKYVREKNGSEIGSNIWYLRKQVYATPMEYQLQYSDP